MPVDRENAGSASQSNTEKSNTEIGRPQAAPAAIPAPQRAPDAGQANSDLIKAEAASPERQPRAAKTRLPRTPDERRNRARFLTFLRLFGGLVTLGVLAYFMWTPGEWPVRLMAWVFLVILADEFGGWFGYLGLLMGGLGYLSPTAPPPEWLIILPLVGGALFALLLVKHSGGPFVLPFAGLLFAGTLLAVSRFGPKFDPKLTLPTTDEFLRAAILAMLVGLAVSFVRQFVGMFLRRQARIRERQAAESVVAVAPTT